MGVEPTRSHEQRILSPHRLPLRHDPDLTNLVRPLPLYTINMSMRNNLRSLIRLMLESDVTAPMPSGYVPHDPSANRKKKMEKLAEEVADKLGLADVRYLSRSKRLYGAYTYAAVDERNENVILKIQPKNELDGYVRAQQMIARLPDRVARHMPAIYKIRTLDELNVRPPYDDFGNPEELGVIVMERLEELPGNMFDLITQPATRSMHSLESLVRDRDAFTAVIDDALSRSKRSIDSAIAGAPKDADPAEETDRLRKMLVSVIYNPNITNQSGGIMLSTVDGLRDAVTEKIELWYRALGITRRGAVQSLSQMIMSSITSLLGRRAVPKEPTKEPAGPLGRISGIRDLVKALDDLKSLNISPSDVHGNNIMLRPETGELVLADLGHFT